MNILPRIVLLNVVLVASTVAADGNRLSYVDEFCDPYYVGRDFPKLTTPQWVGEEGVEAVVVLAIDDMRDTAKYETYLRPILHRLKKIDGRAPVSIMTCKVEPQDPQLQTWIKEGLTIEVHTIDHPCPLLQGGDFAKAKSTYDRCVDLMNQIAGNKPVAFRMPCCDSLNTPSPRFWAEIFNKKTQDGNYLQIDTSVFNITTAQDKDLPRELVLDPDGSERFRKYLPFKSFVNTIEDYPYPYVIAGKCWEFPCIVPSDWEAQHIQKPNNPKTVEDMKAALDAVVIKQGTYNLVFHPHGWIRNDQIVELIDHAVAKHGRKVKFLTFREAAERLQEHLLAGHTIRAPLGDATRVSVLDINHDGFMDVHFTGVLTSGKLRQRTWDPAASRWIDDRVPAGADDAKLATTVEIRHGFRDALLHDVHSDGETEVIGQQRNEAGKPIVVVRSLSGTSTLNCPDSLVLWDEQGRDAGLRFVDVNEDGFDDILFSNGERYSLHLWNDEQEGWSIKVIDGQRGQDGGMGPVIPMVVRPDGTNNGAWFHSRHMWVQNEDTNRLPDLVERLSFDDMLKDHRRRQGEQGEHGELPAAKSPQASLNSIHIRPGFQVELVAAEPLVADPVAFDWGPDGSLWVAEMGDYPNGATWNKAGDPLGEPGGRIKRLTDTDGDGKYDHASLFLDKVPFPTGVKAWRGGVLVSAAPAVFYAEDTDDDGIADQQKTLFTGFAEGNQQHRVNGLRWGLDNWLYLANGDSGGTIKSSKTGKSVDIRGRDVRIRPDSGEIETVSGQTQSGRNRDDWGNWFGGNNSNPMWHYALDDNYLRRNPHFAPPSVRRPISRRPGAAPVFPTSRTLTRFNDFDKVDRFTSACSPMIYRDTLLFSSGTHAFLCEPVHNLVHREVVTQTGATFSSQRAFDERESEFLSSADNWFRPTMVRTGPDGALWIADMYRLVIEHPEWIPAAWQQRLDLRSGHDKGRIYRVYPTGTKPRPVPLLEPLDSRGLVESLKSPNGWIRDTAQQILLWDKHDATVPLLEELALSKNSPRARTHALSTLAGFGKLSPELIVQALQADHAGLRRQAIRLAEAELNRNEAIAALVVKAVADDDALVRVQAAYALGSWKHADAGPTLARLLTLYADDPLVYAAAISSLTDENLASVIRHVSPSASRRGDLAGVLLRIAVASKNTDALQVSLQSLLTHGSDQFALWQLRALIEAFETGTRQGQRPEQVVGGQRQLSTIRQRTQTMASNASLDADIRVASVRVLGLVASGDDDYRLITSFLAPRHAAELQQAAVAALASRDRRETPRQLLANWQTHTPNLRTRILDSLLTRATWTKELVDAIAAGSIAPASFDARRRQQLLEYADESIRKRAAEIFATASSVDRRAVLKQYEPVSKLNGDRVRGKEVFTKRCGTCHRLDGVGKAVGPELTALTDKSPQAMLVAILDPNRAVEDKFRDYLAITNDGRQFRGMITEETGNSIKLVGADGKEQVILRTDLEEMRSTGKSLMPEGVEKDLAVQDVADVIAFVRAVSLPPKSFPGNTPQVAPVRDDGSIRCLAMHARIYGPSLVFEEQYRNLGFWGSAKDQATWSLDVPKAGRYRVTLDYACADGTQGNRFVLAAAGETLRGIVPGTGTWDDYRSLNIGHVELPAGSTELSFRSDGQPKSFLMDLRMIRLLPE